MKEASKLIVRLLSHLDRPRQIQLGLCVLAGLIFSFTTLLPPLLIRRVIFWLTDGDGQVGSFAAIAIGLVLIYLVRGIGRYYYGVFSHQVAYHTLHNLMSLVYRHIQSLSHRFHNKQRTGSLIARSINDIEAIEDFVAHGVPELVLAVVIPLTMIAILLTINPLLTLLVVLPLPIAGYIIFRFTRQIRHMWRSVRSRAADLIAQVQDNISGVTEIKSFGREAEQSALVTAHSAKFRDASIKSNSLSLMPAGIVEFAGGGGLIIAAVIGGAFALNGRLSVADLFVFISYVSYIYQPFLKLADISDNLHKAASSCERVFELLDTPIDIVSPANALRPDIDEWQVEFRNVDFAYKEGEPILHDIDLTIHEGEMVALVGATGAGKTTISRLIPRFFDPQAGQILVDGYDVKTLDLAFLRDSVAAVHQDIFLFHGTVRQNLLFGRSDATMDDLIDAATAAHAHEFIMNLPNGYDTVIGERGVRLSGGQKQRLSIARALLKDAPILILDEATSSVDVETEAKIQQAFTRLVRNRTTLVIAHRLSTIRHADKIVVMKDGRIVESGTHDELVIRGGRYAQMVRAQDVANDWELASMVARV
ncbi:MAG: ABC transporter ATP-binding protein [Chloroflexota bacterium]